MDKSVLPAGQISVDLCVFFLSVDLSVDTLTALTVCAVCTYTQHIIRVGPVLGDFLKA